MAVGISHLPITASSSGKYTHTHIHSDHLGSGSIPPKSQPEPAFAGCVRTRLNRGGHNWQPAAATGQLRRHAVCWSAPQGPTRINGFSTTAVIMGTREDLRVFKQMWIVSSTIIISQNNAIEQCCRRPISSAAPQKCQKTKASRVKQEIQINGRSKIHENNNNGNNNTTRLYASKY